MGCIISTRGSNKKSTKLTLCGKKYNLTDLFDFFNGKITCTACLVREDGMLGRGYTKKKYRCWINSVGEFQCVPEADYGTWRNKYIIPQKAAYKGIIEMWDSASLRGTIKLSKLGAVDLGFVEEK